MAGLDAGVFAALRADGETERDDGLGVALTQRRAEPPD
jgi:hypothetical protein